MGFLVGYAYDVNKAACFFQAIGNALCATGFGESIAGVISDVHHPIAERAIAAIVIILLTLVNLVSDRGRDRISILG